MNNGEKISMEGGPARDEPVNNSADSSYSLPVSPVGTEATLANEIGKHHKTRPWYRWRNIKRGIELFGLFALVYYARQAHDANTLTRNAILSQQAAIFSIDVEMKGLGSQEQQEVYAYFVNKGRVAAERVSGTVHFVRKAADGDTIADTTKTINTPLILPDEPFDRSFHFPDAYDPKRFAGETWTVDITIKYDNSIKNVTQHVCREWNVILGPGGQAALGWLDCEEANTDRNKQS